MVAEPSLQVVADRLSAAELAAGYTQTTGRQWTQPIGFIHALFEVAVDVMKRAEIGPIRRPRRGGPATNRHTMVGPSNGARRLPPIAQGQHRQDLVGGQWRTKEGARYELVVVDNQTAAAIPPPTRCSRSPKRTDS